MCYLCSGEPFLVIKQIGKFPESAQRYRWTTEISSNCYLTTSVWKKRLYSTAVLILFRSLFQQASSYCWLEIISVHNRARITSISSLELSCDSVQVLNLSLNYYSNSTPPSASLQVDWWRGYFPCEFSSCAAVHNWHQQLCSYSIVESETAGCLVVFFPSVNYSPIANHSHDFLNKKTWHD
jgi:hypothetical protein